MSKWTFMAQILSFRANIARFYILSFLCGPTKGHFDRAFENKKLLQTLISCFWTCLNNFLKVFCLVRITFRESWLKVGSSKNSSTRSRSKNRSSAKKTLSLQVIIGYCISGEEFYIIFWMVFLWDEFHKCQKTVHWQK